MAKGTLIKLTVSRKILIVVFTTFLVSVALLVYFGSQNQRSDIQALAISNNQTISQLMAVQMSGGLKWKKAKKVAEVYEEIGAKEGSVLADILTFDKNGELVTEYHSDTLSNADVQQVLDANASDLNQVDIFSYATDTHHIIIAPVITAKGDFVGRAAFAWSLGSLNEQLQANLYDQLMLAAVVLLGLVVLTAFLLNQFIGTPLRQLTNAMVSLASGDNSVEIKGLERGDDIGDMSRSVQVFKENAEEVLTLQAERQREAEEKANNEATQRLADEERLQDRTKREKLADEKSAEERALFMGELASKLESSVNAVSRQISGSASDMEQQAKTMVNSAENTDHHSTAIAQASEQAAHNVSGVASATEELSASLQEIGRQVSVSSNLTEETLKETEATDTVVNDLAATAGEIGNVVNLINDIAAQTNLLALNATIEAARAGDAGKGFAVVASEVKGLASQTTKATEEIAKQIDQMQLASGNAVSAVQGIKAMITKINDTVQVMSTAVQEQNTATLEITKNVQMASERTGEVSKSVSDVSSMASVSGTAAGQLLTAVGELAEFSSNLQSEVDTVIQDIRSMA
ncbi:MAG: methyl-accepting chemotaxis protein [Sneathiella sp.]